MRERGPGGFAGVPSERAEVSSVFPGSPAAKAGFRAGDVVLSCRGLAVTHATLQEAIKSIAPGRTLDVQVRRQGAIRTLRPTLGDRSLVALPGERSDDILGMIVVRATRITPSARRPGLLVVGVRTNSPADRADVRPGAFIVDVREGPASIADDLQHDEAAFAPDLPVVLTTGQARTLEFIVLSPE